MPRGPVFNSCLLNRYVSGADKIGMHADDEKELGPEPTIASLSIGTPRVFRIQPRSRPDERVGVLLGDGDLLIMSGRSQLDYLHSLPAAPRAHWNRGPRINLTFRYVHDVGK